MALGGISVDVNPFAILLGKLKATAGVKSGQGDLEVGVNFGLISLIKGGLLPSRLSFEAKQFSLDQPVQFGLALASSAPGANPLVAPLLGAIGLTAQLNGKADLELDAANPTQSTGAAEINLTNALLKLDHPTLGLPNQKFIKAQIKAKVDKGALEVDKSSGLVSEELEILPEGKITLKPVPSASLLDLKIIVKLNKSLKEKFGFLTDAVTGNSGSDGQLTMQVRGQMDQPAVTTF
jgi:type II secretion system protein N